MRGPVNINTEIKIKNYRPEVLKAIREISITNSILGAYKNHLLSEEIIADLLTSYFIEYEPQSCFVAEKDGEVVGYVLGSCDVLKMRKMIKGRILPGLAKKIFKNGLIFRSHNLRLIKNIVYSYVKGEFNVPDFSREYPATLHVNIAPSYQGRMIGSQLVNHFLELLKEKQVRGIHFGVLSERAREFFTRLNFEILFKGHYSFLRYLTGETLPHYIMGKKL